MTKEIKKKEVTKVKSAVTEKIDTDTYENVTEPTIKGYEGKTIKEIKESIEGPLVSFGGIRVEAFKIDKDNKKQIDRILNNAPRIYQHYLDLYERKVENLYFSNGDNWEDYYHNKPYLRPIDLNKGMWYVISGSDLIILDKDSTLISGSKYVTIRSKINDDISYNNVITIFNSTVIVGTISVDGKNEINNSYVKSNVLFTGRSAISHSSIVANEIYLTKSLLYKDMLDSDRYSVSNKLLTKISLTKSALANTTDEAYLSISLINSKINNDIKLEYNNFNLPKTELNKILGGRKYDSIVIKDTYLENPLVLPYIEYSSDITLCINKRLDYGSFSYVYPINFARTVKEGLYLCGKVFENDINELIDFGIKIENNLINGFGNNLGLSYEEIEEFKKNWKSFKDDLLTRLKLPISTKLTDGSVESNMVMALLQQISSRLKAYKSLKILDPFNSSIIDGSSYYYDIPF